MGGAKDQLHLCLVLALPGATGKWPGNGAHHGKVPFPHHLHPMFPALEHGEPHISCRVNRVISTLPSPRHPFYWLGKWNQEPLLLLRTLPPPELLSRGLMERCPSSAPPTSAVLGPPGPCWKACNLLLSLFPASVNPGILLQGWGWKEPDFLSPHPWPLADFHPCPFCWAFYFTQLLGVTPGGLVPREWVFSTPPFPVPPPQFQLVSNEVGGACCPELRVT